MKAKRRHELKENVLAHELGQLKEFLRKYGSWIVGAIAAAGIALVVVWHLHTREQQAFDEEKRNFNLLRDAADMERDARLNGFVQMADTAQDPIVAASSAIFAANMYSQAFLDLLEKPASEEARKARDNAARYYRQVIEKHAELRQIVANAHLGLGILAENGGDKEAARGEYDAAVAVGGKGSLTHQEAAKRLNRLDAWFAGREFPETRPATAPATASAPATDKPDTQPAEAP